VLFEGKPVRTPDAGAFWRVLSEHKVKSFFCCADGFQGDEKRRP
jgi:propionyl-CoA synthetase